MKHALLVIDIQNDYFSEGAFPLENADAACQEAVKAINHARQQGWLIVGIQHIGERDSPFFKPGTEGVKLHPDILAALGDAPVITKKKADSFFGTPLEQLLRDQDITDLCLIGMMTQHCVTHTALSPQAQGMTVQILAKGCAAPTTALSNLALSGLAARCHIL